MLNNNPKTHAMLLVAVGGYIFYLAYKIWEAQAQDTAAMPFAVAVAVITFFVLAGIGILIYAFHVWRNRDNGDDGNASGVK